jgi:hypothetical protein
MMNLMSEDMDYSESVEKGEDELDVILSAITGIGLNKSDLKTTTL